MSSDNVKSDFTRKALLEAVASGLEEGIWTVRDSAHEKAISGAGKVGPNDFIRSLLQLDQTLNAALFPTLDDRDWGEDDKNRLLLTINEQLDLSDTVDNARKMLYQIRDLFSEKVADKKETGDKLQLGKRLSALNILQKYEAGVLGNLKVGLSDEELGLKPDLHAENRENNQIFLSYQVIDWLYTMGLYYMFRKEGWFLFVDWMHNGKLEDGNRIKQILKPEIVGSAKFASLPHYRLVHNARMYESALTVWCAWEIGMRYNEAIASSQKKYLITPNPQMKMPSIFHSFFAAARVSQIVGQDSD